MRRKSSFITIMIILVDGLIKECYINRIEKTTMYTVAGTIYSAKPRDD